MATKLRLEVYGEPDIAIVGKQPQHWLCKVDGVKVWLAATQFRFMAILAIKRVSGLSGWVHCHNLDPSGNTSRFVYRLKHDVKMSTRVEDFVENDRRGNYRLRFESDQILVDYLTLSKHEDANIRKAVEEARGVICHCTPVEL